MHVKPDWDLTRTDLAALFQGYGDKGLEVHITELDIELCERTSGTTTICDPDDTSLL